MRSSGGDQCPARHRPHRASTERLLRGDRGHRERSCLNVPTHAAAVLIGPRPLIILPVDVHEVGVRIVASGSRRSMADGFSGGDRRRYASGQMEECFGYRSGSQFHVRHAMRLLQLAFPRTPSRARLWKRFPLNVPEPPAAMPYVEGKPSTSLPLGFHGRPVTEYLRHGCLAPGERPATGPLSLGAPIRLCAITNGWPGQQSE